MLSHARQNLLGSGARRQLLWCPCCPSPGALPKPLNRSLDPLPTDTVVRIAGKTIKPQSEQSHFPGTYPLEFFREALGQPLPNEATFVEDMQKELVSQFQPKTPKDYAEFMNTGVCNAREHAWVILSLPPRCVFPPHVHPGLEMVYIVNGTLHEIRVNEPIKGYEPIVGAPGPDISSGYTFKSGSVAAGGWIMNEVGSCHQSFTLSDPCLMIAVWGQASIFMTADQMPPDVLLPVNHTIDKELFYSME